MHSWLPLPHHAPYLPTEILFEILASLTDTDTPRSPSTVHPPDLDLIAASLVCRSWRAAASVFMHKHGWRVLDLATTGWIPEAILRIARIVEEAERLGVGMHTLFPGVVHLTLDPATVNDLTSPALVLLSRLLRPHTLELCSSSLLPSAIPAFFALLGAAAHPYCKTLYLHHTYPPHLLHPLLVALRPTHLHLINHTTLTADHFALLAPLATTLQTLTLRLPSYNTPCNTYTLAKILRRLPNLRHFALWGAQCDDPEALNPVFGAIASVCLEIETLEVPDLYSTPPAHLVAGTQTPRALVRLVKSCTKLRRIDLTGHACLDRSFLALLLRHQRELREIVLAGCVNLADPLERGGAGTGGGVGELWPELETLDLSQGARDVSSEFLWRVVRSAPRLREIAIPGHMVAEMEFRARLAGTGLTGWEDGGKFRKWEKRLEVL
ncbi:hypothetical protein BC937DRAFT_94415 [Endogone sp. FLAS-F59071]|nr:hypothetical protein BC937DRAFT_94415 [Endogone sp. FLAS-F59071]|eukprot:RUS14053.1 hypothetical protein BC937DRAFT_94415 [Endogone sp. FLAS-F59071]